jgi:hypothetical protein
LGGPLLVGMAVNGGAESSRVRPLGVLQNARYRLEVFEHDALKFGTAQNSCRMQNRKYRQTILLPGFAPDPCDTFTGEKAPQRKPAHRNDNLGVNQFNLTVEVFAAGRDFGWGRIAIVWRPAFHHISDVNFLSIPISAHGREEPLQKKAGRAHERPAFFIFPKTGPLAYEHYVGLGISFSRYGLGASDMQRAVITISN